MSSKEEFLAESVRKYPCLYEKSKKSHKDKLSVINAWKKVGEECEITGEEAKHSFENLKRRFVCFRNGRCKGKVKGVGVFSMARAIYPTPIY